VTVSKPSPSTGAACSADTQPSRRSEAVTAARAIREQDSIAGDLNGDAHACRTVLVRRRPARRTVFVRRHLSAPWSRATCGPSLGRENTHVRQGQKGGQRV